MRSANNEKKDKMSATAAVDDVMVGFDDSASYVFHFVV